VAARAGRQAHRGQEVAHGAVAHARRLDGLGDDVDEALLRESVRDLCLGFGRIVGSVNEEPTLLANLV
jgi:hypothetical protein